VGQARGLSARARAALVGEHVARDVQPVRSGEPARLQGTGGQLERRPAVRRHRTVAVGAHDRDDHPRPTAGGAQRLDPVARKLRLHQATGSVVAAVPDEARSRAQGDSPGGDVGGLAAGADPSRRDDVVARDERLVGTDDDVEHQVAERADQHVHRR